MNTKDELNMLLLQLDTLSQDLHELANNISNGNINERDDAMVHNLGDFANVISDNFKKVFRREHLL